MRHSGRYQPRRGVAGRFAPPIRRPGSDFAASDTAARPGEADEESLVDPCCAGFDSHWCRADAVAASQAIQVIPAAQGFPVCSRARKMRIQICARMQRHTPASASSNRSEHLILALDSPSRRSICVEERWQWLPSQCTRRQMELFQNTLFLQWFTSEF